MLRVYLQLSNLDFWVWLQKGRGDNNLWLTNKTRSGVYRPFGTRSIQILMCPSFTLSLLTGIGVCSVVLQLTRWVHDAKRGSTPMQNIQFIMCEVCYLNGESGLLSRMSVSSPTFSSFFCGYVLFIDVNWFKIYRKVIYSWRIFICFKYRGVLLLLQNWKYPHSAWHKVKDSFKNFPEEQSWVKLLLNPHT